MKFFDSVERQGLHHARAITQRICPENKVVFHMCTTLTTTSLNATVSVWNKLREGNVRSDMLIDSNTACANVAIQAMRKAGIPILGLLAPEDGSTAKPWQHRFIVTLSVDSAEMQLRKLPQYQRPPVDAYGNQSKLPVPQIYACWSVVVMDEYHEMKTVDAKANGVVGQLPGRPPIIAISATTFVKTIDLEPTLCASLRQYVKEANYDTFLKLSSKDRSQIRNKLTWAEGVNEDRQRLIEQRTWLGCHEQCQLIDKVVASGEADVSNDAQAEIAAFARKYRRLALTFDSALMWFGTLALDLPANSAFDKEIEMDRHAAQYLGPLYRQEKESLQGKKTNQRRLGFLALVDRFRVLCAFPRLIELCIHDEAVRIQLGNYNVKNAETINAKNSALANYTEQLIIDNTMSFITSAIHQYRQQKNGLGKPTKIIIGAHKPMNAAIVLLCMQALARDKAYPWINEDSIATAVSWQHRKMTEDACEAFCTTKNVQEDYEDDPWVMVACTGAIRSGVTLVPGSVVFIVDSNTWQTFPDQQLSCHERRTKLIQVTKNAQTDPTDSRGWLLQIGQMVSCKPK